MTSQASLSSGFRRLHRSAMAWLSSWWRLLHFAVLFFSLALSPSTYGRAHRPALARQLVLATAPNLMWFTVLSALISLVLIRIVVVTALSYGLSRFALEMVVRVLVLELIPLTAALFVALRITLPDGIEFAQLRARGTLDAMQREGADLLHREFFPRVAAGVFAVWMLAAVSCVLSLVLAYLTIYGFTPWALQGYTRTVGQVFNPAVTLILMLKIVFFSFAVGLIPLASSFNDDSAAGRRIMRLRSVHGLSEMLRLFSVILLIEIASLMGNYY
ncbi:MULTISPECIES: MlaE family ABC transporter permease [unclassified Janthinobacterium]|uniref:MlaE family ABC transporter permease n=1 Tax=unclassified Janthinobacterium TaxID=2610881 RepID=UPI00047786F7|nr:MULTISPECIES: ABC transporter permease [unclassified Janthinobacterium]MEC5160411.1 phospholipid/cholesterol/gamma-HCH transport system permease protein [Janthinobacterium sp. CG_S6]